MKKSRVISALKAQALADKEKALMSLLEGKGESQSPLQSKSMTLYSELLREPGSKLSKKMLHTMYKAEEFYN